MKIIIGLWTTHALGGGLFLWENTLKSFLE